MSVFCCCKQINGVIEGEDLADHFSMPQKIDQMPESQKMEHIRRASISIASLTEPMTRSESAMEPQTPFFGSSASTRFPSEFTLQHFPLQSRVVRQLSHPSPEAALSIFPNIQPSPAITPHKREIDTLTLETVARIVNEIEDEEDGLNVKASVCQILPKSDNVVYQTCHVVKNGDYLVISPVGKLI